MIMSVLANSDSYKMSHYGFMNKGTTQIYSNLTPRSAGHFPAKWEGFDEKTVFFGLQYFIMDYLMDEWNKTFFKKSKKAVIAKFKRLTDAYLGQDSVPMSHFEQLHDLGYLPLEIKALPEGSAVNLRVPMLTITNTHPDFAWLTNYMETVMSCELWKPCTTATIIRQYRLMVNKFAMETTGSLEGTDFQVHGFEFRGMSGRKDATINGAAFLLSSCGTDTACSLGLIEDFYFTDITKDLIAASVPASEHSIACLGTAVEGELESYRKWITQDYPNGVVSLVSDTYDYWKVITEYLPALKDDILNRGENALGMSKVVIRPDSGDPVDIVCGDVDATKGSPEEKGTIECLWDTFGGTVTEQGYKVLNPKIGVIYGDSITLDRAHRIMEGLKQKGFASTNIVFGVGSFTMNHNTRDSMGMAVKATYAEVDGQGYELFKDPITDDGTKKSAKGLLRVEKEGDDFVLYDQQTKEQAEGGCLKTVFLNSVMTNPQSFADIRTNLWQRSS